MGTSDSKHEPARRSTDIAHLEPITAWKNLRRYITIGSWFGHMLFILYGILYALSYGVLGGEQFFTDMFLVDKLGSLSSSIGAVLGIFIGLICVWAICVIVAASIGSLVYWYKYRSFPTSSE